MRRNFLIYFARTVGFLVIKVPFRVKTVGKENLPEGGYILASNHQSHMDGPVLYVTMNRTVGFLAKEELFKKGFWRWAFYKLGQIPIARGKGDRRALSNAVDHVKKGHVLGIFPEGTTSRDGKVKKGHTGVARIALEARTPIVPVAIKGTYEAMPRGRIIPIPRKIILNVGKPLEFKRFYGMNESREVTRFVTDKVMDYIKMLKKVDSRKMTPDKYREKLGEIHKELDAKEFLVR